ncbi:unnamed protein product [Nesidiocoris tenuis]|uniref:Uncharacterized protein n=1 Tax=Nesidiocoris tenuis TaxID=355587 RepID=A0A6H5HI08_9HEMI|nr:unnamed protein product [Nesidiocoris tenuis]
MNVFRLCFQVDSFNIELFRLMRESNHLCSNCEILAFRPPLLRYSTTRNLFLFRRIEVVRSVATQGTVQNPDEQYGVLLFADPTVSNGGLRSLSCKIGKDLNFFEYQSNITRGRILTIIVLPEVDEDWVVALLKKNVFHQKPVQITDVQVSYAVPLGDNFTSTIYRVVVKTQLGSGRSKKIPVIVKVAPSDELPISKVVKGFYAFRQEIKWINLNRDRICYFQKIKLETSGSNIRLKPYKAPSTHQHLRSTPEALTEMSEAGDAMSQASDRHEHVQRKWNQYTRDVLWVFMQIDEHVKSHRRDETHQ